jgi:carbonic anhydrase
MNDTVTRLLAGNEAHAAAYDDRFDDLQTGQAPDAVTVCCSDSRVLQDHLWGNDEPGHLFTCGNIGNRVVQDTHDGERVSGDVLYPLAHTGTETAIVVGHTGCGAVTATYQAVTDGHDEPPGIEHCVSLLRPTVEAGVEALPEGLSDVEAVNHLVEYNVDRQVETLVESPDVPEGVDVLGVVYDFQDVYDGRRGEVHVINANGKREPDQLREAVPAIADRVKRRWIY